MRTYVPKLSEIKRDWWLVDAEGKTLGRLATTVATRLRGKHKVIYMPNLDTGDHVVVVNAARVVVTGRKTSEKVYHRYTGYPGGLRSSRFAQTIAKHPERVIEEAVWGMLPKGPLGRAMYRKLKVYAGKDHPHAAQRPKTLKG